MPGRLVLVERLKFAACTHIPHAQRGESLVASTARGLRNLLCFAFLLQDLPGVSVWWFP